MLTDLRQHIQATTLVDTHEHLRKEADYTENGPDVLQDLFANYISADLIVAGATQAAVDTLLDAGNADIEARWAGISAAWQHCQHTGYGEAVRLIAKRAYGMDDINPAAIAAAAEHNRQLRQPGERLRILKEEAKIGRASGRERVLRPEDAG